MGVVFQMATPRTLIPPPSSNPKGGRQREGGTTAGGRSYSTYCTVVVLKYYVVATVQLYTVGSSITHCARFTGALLLLLPGSWCDG